MMLQDGDCHPGFCSDGVFLYFCRQNYAKAQSMTHIEALRQVLEELGGRAHTSDIYSRVLPLITYKEGSDIKATLRADLQRATRWFRRSEGMSDGWYELVSYQEEIAERDRRIKELEEENCRLRSVKTQDEFVRDLLEGTKKFFKHERQKTVAICQILGQMGQTEASEELDAWIEGKEYKPSVNIHVHGNLNDVHGNKSVNF